MKVVFPQNVDKSLLWGLQISIGSFSISLIQLFVMAVGIMFWVLSFSTCSKAWAKVLWVVLAIVIIGIFAVICFFKCSELWLPAFIAKKIKDGYFDTTEKFQVNYPKYYPTDILIKKSHQEKGKQKIEIKSGIDLTNLQKMEDDSIL